MRKIKFNLFDKIKHAKADSLYIKNSKTGQIENTRHVHYSDNVNYLQNYAVKEGQSNGFAQSTNNILGSGIVNTIVREAIGNKLNVESAVDEQFFAGKVDTETIKNAKNQIESFFDFWQNDPKFCDYKRNDTLGKLEQLMCRMAVAQGEFFVIIRIISVKGLYFPQIELVSPLLCSSPNNIDTENIVSGIKFDEQGREISYFFKVVKNNEPNSYEWKEYPKYSRSGRVQVIHAKFGEVHPNQARGRSALTASTETLVQTERFHDANLSKAVNQAGMYWSIEKDVSTIEDGSESTFDNIKNSITGGQNPNLNAYPMEQEPTIEMKPGIVVEMKPGEKIHSIESTAPTSTTKDFMRVMGDMLASDTGVPAEKLFKRFESSYSASQASMQEAHYNAVYWKNEICSTALNEIYSQFVWCLVVQDLVKLPYFLDNEFARKAWCKVQWYGQALVHIDPVKAVNASVLRIQNGLSTREIESRNLTGMNWDTLVPRLKEEEEKIKAYGIHVTSDTTSENNDSEVENEESENNANE